MKLLERQLWTALKTEAKRSASILPSFWAEQNRLMSGSFPGPWRFDNYPWLRAMHDSKERFNVGQKAAQLGYTELVLNMALYTLDIEKKNVMYVLPALKPDAADFSSSRFDPAVEENPELIKKFNLRNTGHKRLGSANMYIRGSRSKSGLKSVPIYLLILDEVDEMTQENIPLALQRTSGQLNPLTWLISTPTIQEHGINKYFRLSTQDHYFFKCPSCSRSIEFTFPDCIEIVGESPDDPRTRESYYKCSQCSAKLAHGPNREYYNKAEWVSAKPQSLSRGFIVNQMYSPTVNPWDFAQKYLIAQTNDSDAQELYNSMLGLPYEPKGARVTDEEINKVRSDFLRTDKNQGRFVTIGIDVGRLFHFFVIDWLLPKNMNQYGANGHMYCKPKVINFGGVETLAEIEHHIKWYNPAHVVIDAQPEKRLALGLANKFPGLISLCYYAHGVMGKTFKQSEDITEPTLNTDRTSWLDLTLGRYKTGNILLPADIDNELRQHLKAPVRIIKKDHQGNPVSLYLTPDHIPDHYAHAHNYAEIALKVALGYGGTVEEM